MRLKKILVLSVVCLFFPVLAHAAQNKPATQNIHITADVFELDGKKNVVVASGNVVVTQRDITIWGRTAEFDQNKRVVKLMDQITLKRGNLTLTCEEITAYGQEDRVEANTKVEFYSGDLHGSSDKASYDISAQLIRLEGQPKAWRGTDEVSGRIILIDLKKNKITTKGNAKVTLDLEKIR